MLLLSSLGLGTLPPMFIFFGVLVIYCRHSGRGSLCGAPMVYSLVVSLFCCMGRLLVKAGFVALVSWQCMYMSTCIDILSIYFSSLSEHCKR